MSTTMSSKVRSSKTLSGDASVTDKVKKLMVQSHVYERQLSHVRRLKRPLTTSEDANIRQNYRAWLAIGEAHEVICQGYRTLHSTIPKLVETLKEYELMYDFAKETENVYPVDTDLELKFDLALDVEQECMTVIAEGIMQASVNIQKAAKEIEMLFITLQELQEDKGRYIINSNACKIQTSETPSKKNKTACSPSDQEKAQEPFIIVTPMVEEPVEEHAEHEDEAKCESALVLRN